MLYVICLMLLGSAASVHAHSQAYNLGFRQGISACLDIQHIVKNSAERDDCIAGKLAGEQYRASLTYPYKVGFAHGKEDRLISIGDDACKSFSGALGLLDTPQWECQQGYDAGWAAPINHTAQQTNKQTLAYKIGYKAGTNNGTYSACNEFSGRESQICSNAYEEGFLTIPRSHEQIFKLGYNYGFTAARDKDPDPDRAGDCSFDPVDLKKKAVCEVGWNKEFDADEKK
jgi:hypothetical protein